MRWPFGPPHLTLKPSNKKHQKKKKQKKNKQKNQKKKEKKEDQKNNSKNTKKWLFSYQSNFSFFLVAFQNFPFLTSWPRKPEPQKHYKNRGFKCFFLETSCVSRNGRFWTKKTKIYKFQLSFFLAYFLLFQKQKTQKSAETPIFIVF